MTSKRSLKNNLAGKALKKPNSSFVILICEGEKIKANRLKLADVCGIDLPLNKGKFWCRVKFLLKN
jgi:hypothetical protein